MLRTLSSIREFTMLFLLAQFEYEQTSDSFMTNRLITSFSMELDVYGLALELTHLINDR